jgi:hypothetical protein
VTVAEELSEYARGLGLCGERFGIGGSVVCDAPAGHPPISEAMGWLHEETISGPIDTRRGELYEKRGMPEAWL